MLLMGYGVDNVTSEKFWLIKKFKTCLINIS